MALAVYAVTADREEVHRAELVRWALENRDGHKWIRASAFHAAITRGLLSLEEELGLIPHGDAGNDGTH